MSTFAKCSECHREMLISEDIGYNLSDNINIICHRCDPPIDSWFDWIHLYNGWIWAVSDPDILDNFPKSTDINWQEGYISHCITCPGFNSDDWGEYDCDCDCDCDFFEYHCYICEKKFEIDEEQLLFPVCRKCSHSNEAGEFRRPVHPSEITQPGMYQRLFEI